MKEDLEKQFGSFDISYGYIGGPVCKIKDNIILEKFKTIELEMEIKRRKLEEKK